MLLVDGGNFAARDNEFDYWSKTEFLWKMMAKLGYDAVTPGEMELVEGRQRIEELYKSQPDIKVVSANVTDKSGRLVWPEYTIIEKNGVRFGVTGVTGSGFYQFNVGKGVQKKDDFNFQEVRDALNRVIPILRKKADVVVVLYHDGPGDAKTVAEQIPGMDVVIVGHNPGYMFNPDRVGETLIVRPGNRGQYLGVLELSMDGAGKIVDYSGEAKPMDEAVAKDTEFEPPETAFDTDYQARKRQEDRKAAAEKAMIQGTEKYIGAEMCARCHADVYAKWMETPHARAYETLVKQGEQNNEQCMKCHVVGWGQESGYALTVSKRSEEGAVVEATDEIRLRNVQCESCHGLGTFHGTSAMDKTPAEATCRNCHVGKYGENFDYAQARVHGVH